MAVMVVLGLNDLARVLFDFGHRGFEDFSALKSSRLE